MNLREELNQILIKYQKGGIIYYPDIEKGVLPSDKNAFLTALNFENKYITSPKFKERVEKAGYNFQDYMSNMKGILKNISLTVDDSKINASGAYYRPDTNEVGISTKLIPSMLKKSDVFSHEIGHSFSNENLKKFIDDRNILVPTDPIERKKMEEKLKDQNYYNGDGHEQEDREMVADVHSARYELYKYGIDNKSKNIYDGRYSNFTNSAYNDMLKIAEDNPFSASARLLNKVGSRKFDKEWDKVTSDVKTINSDAEQERYDETLNKIDEKAKKLNKQYIFEIMNRIVQSDNTNDIKYAQEGGIIKIIDRKGNLIKLNKDSDQYRNLYNNKLIQGYDPKTDTYYLTPTKEKVVYNNTAKTSGEIPEIVLKGKKADWVKYKEDYIKNNPKEKYIQEYLDAYPWAHQSLTNYPKRLDESYENMVNNYIGEQIVKNKPQGNKSREDWLNSMTEQEQRFVQRNPKYGATLWQDTVEGGKALFNLGNDLQISRIKNSDNYKKKKKKDLIEEHNKNPILSNISDITQVLSPLTVPSKMVQSVYRPEYSIKDAIYGTKNKAGMLEDIATDPLNLVGAEFFNKFDDINKIIKPLKNTVEMFPKSSNIFVKVNKESGESLFNKLFNKKIPFIQNTDDYKDYIDVLRKEEIDYINSTKYYKLRDNNTGETSTQILKSVNKMKKNMDRTSYNITHRLNPNSGEYLNSISTFFSPKKGKLLPSLDFNPSINIGDSRYSETIEGVLSHEIKHGYSPVGTDLGIYRNYPTLKVKIPENKPFEYYLSRPYEQQVRFNKIKSTLQKDVGVKRGTPITEEHLNYYFNKPYDVRIDGDVHELFNNLDNSVTKHDVLDVLNKAWGIVPAIGGSAVIGHELSNSKDSNNSQPSYQDGGSLNNIRNILNNIYMNY